MPEPRLPASDFERWIARSSVPPDERNPESLCEGIAAALKSRDFEAVRALLTVLPFRDPRRAQTVHDMIVAVCDGDDRRAMLLAVLGA